MAPSPARIAISVTSRGDVIGLLDASGAMGSPAFSYTYDPWGNLISIKDSSGNAVTDAASPALINPIRYRGYYYDAESGLYYLQSRYYDPEVGRFINADAFVSTGQGLLGTNMFAYCGNNPVNNTDEGGFFWKSLREKLKTVVEVATAVTATVAAGVAVAGEAISYAATDSGGGEQSPAKSPNNRRVLQQTEIKGYKFP